jgi:putative tryptophan/tyrosine transport system substrate-binding protein
MMKRREFITLLGGAAAAWPLAARAQQPGKLPTIGFLGPSTLNAMSQWTASFVQRLRELGWVEGRNVAIEYRWAEGRTERYAEIAAEFVRLKVDVIVTGEAAVPAVKQATSVIPTVFALADDPVGSGSVASLARPGGNVTGLSVQQIDLVGKRIELLRELIPGLRRLAIMANTDAPGVGLEMAEAQAVAGRLGLSGRHISNPASRGHRSCLRGDRGSGGRTLCLWRRAHEHVPDSHQHPGAGIATADYSP